MFLGGAERARELPFGVGAQRVEPGLDPGRVPVEFAGELDALGVGGGVAVADAESVVLGGA